MSVIAARLRSPRFTRTVSWISGLVLFVGALTFVITYFGDEPQRVNVEAQRAGPVEGVTPPREPTVKLDPTARLVAARFIVTAVTRQNLAAAWKITHPELRAGYTYRQWLKGEIPVQPFPAKAISGVSYKVEESHPREAVLNVLIIPKKNAGVSAQTFYIYLKAVQKGGKKRWLVSYFIPSSGAYIVPNVGSNS